MRIPGVCRETQGNRYLNSTREAAKPKLLTDTVYLDRTPYLLNTPVATFDLRKGLEGARPHDPDDFITKITACSPGYTGKNIFDRALSQTFNDDQGIIDYFQCIIGQAAYKIPASSMLYLALELSRSEAGCSEVSISHGLTLAICLPTNYNVQQLYLIENAKEK